MKAVGFQTQGGPEILAFEEATLKATAGEVPVRVKTTGVNTHDIWVNSGLLGSAADGCYAEFVKAPSENVPHISREFPLESAREENETLERGQQFGKLLPLP